MYADESILNGTPYSFSEAKGFEIIAQQEEAIRRRLETARQTLAASLVQAEVSGQQASREIYESNKIESLGPDLGRTSELLTQHASDNVHDPLFQEMLIRSVRSDKNLVDVLGLAAARKIALELASSPHMILSAADLRGLHAQICVGEWFAGSYKTLPNAIEGSDHTTSSPIDTPYHVSQLVEWMNSNSARSSTLMASIAHGWLAHIHPFPDGNGRLSRIVMNSILMRAGLPPAIIRHNTDRSMYIAALAESDAGGDLFPLVRVLLDAQKRYVREISKPGFLRRIVREEIERLSSTAYESWHLSMERFFNELAVALAVRHTTLELLDPVTNAAFNALTEKDPSGNTWAAWVKAGNQSLLLWFAYSTSIINGSVVGNIRFPALRVSVRNYAGAPVPYRQADRRESGGISEIMIIPDLPTRVYLRVERTVRVGHLGDSVDEVADRLAEGLRWVEQSSAVPPNRPV